MIAFLHLHFLHSVLSLPVFQPLYFELNVLSLPELRHVRIELNTFSELDFLTMDVGNSAVSEFTS